MTIENLLTLKAIVVATSLAVFVVWERILPAAPSQLLLRIGQATHEAWRRLFKNVSLFGLNALLSPLIVIPITAWADSVPLGWRPDWWVGLFWIALDILILDLWIYWWHRANHEVSFLWRFHEVHHLDETLDTSSGFRFHFGEVVLSALVRAALILALDIPLASVILFEALVLGVSIFHHSNAKLPERAERVLSRIIVTPSIHWVHHHAIRKDTDSNYGTIFSFWDRVFSSRSATKRYATMKIGVETMRDLSLLRLLVSPFRLQTGTKPAPRPARK